MIHQSPFCQRGVITSSSKPSSMSAISGLGAASASVDATTTLASGSHPTMPPPKHTSNISAAVRDRTTP